MNEEKFSIAKLRQSNEWRVRSGADDTAPYKVMHRCPIGVPTDRYGYDSFVSFQWAYDVEGSSRFANESERNLIASLTKAIDERFKASGAGVLLFTMEEDGLVQWAIITTDPDHAVMEAIEASSENPGTTQYFGEKFGQFKTEIFRDPDWELIKKIQLLFQD